MDRKSFSPLISIRQAFCHQHESQMSYRQQKMERTKNFNRLKLGEFLLLSVDNILQRSINAQRPNERKEKEKETKNLL